jgi:acyl carrier protein
MSDLERRLIRVIAHQLRVEEDSISRDSSFAELGADSLASVEIVMALEDEFDIRISEEDAEGIVSVQKAIDHVARAVGSHAVTEKFAAGDEHD